MAVVLPRYGAGLGGGAEALTKALIEHLGEHVGRIEVWTTCALDHRTWQNCLPRGVADENGITVRRFPVDERDVDTFLKAEFAMRDGLQLTLDEQLVWLAESVNSRELYQHILQHGCEFPVILLAPYLFATTFWGSLIYPERAIVIPCLHDEHYAYQHVFQAQFAQVRALVFNSQPEYELARRLYPSLRLERKSAVVGMGFERPRASVAAVRRERPYLLYSGRKEQGKNLDLLLGYFESAKFAALDLLLIGSGEIDFLKAFPANVIDLGFVSEEEKLALMRGAVALCQPSVNESFSIVIMEAWQQGTPVLVHGECAVTRHHVIQSGGGLYFSNAREFAAVVETIAGNAPLRRRLGECGEEYVRREYAWPRVIQRFLEALRKFGLADESAEEAANHG